jgi:hypothetical protein
MIRAKKTEEKKMKTKKAANQDRNNGRETLEARSPVYGKRIKEMTEKILGIQDEFRTHRATVKIIDEKLVELTKAAEELRGKIPPTPSFDEERADLLAAVSLGEKTKKELSSFDASVEEKLKKHHGEIISAGKELTPMEQTIEALKRKARLSSELMEELAGRHREAVTAFLHEYAEWVGEEYKFHAEEALKALSRVTAYETFIMRVTGANQAFLNPNFRDFFIPSLGLRSTQPKRSQTLGDGRVPPSARLYTFSPGEAHKAAKEEAMALEEDGIKMSIEEV